jgi:predicted ATPase
MDRFVTISGCSGGGKSTLRDAVPRLSDRARAGRRFVVEEIRRDGTALPWVDAIASARRAIEMALADRAMIEAGATWVSFDRGLIDAASAR